MAAAGVDVGYLATHLGMPEANISAAASDPTVNLVNAILAAVAVKAREFDALFSQKLQLEVELETSVRGAEAQRDASNETARKALKDVEIIRQNLNQEESKRQTLENELQSLQSSSSTSQSDIDSLRTRISSLETSNRESLAIIDKKNSTNESLSQELQAQHQKNLKLSQEVTALQQAVQNANALASSAKIREQGLQRQLDAAKRDVEWTDKELKTKAAEALNYRKEKGARIAELQRQNDDATTSIESLKRSEQQLRQRLQEAQTKADDALARIQQLEEGAARREEDFKQQVERLQRLHELTEQKNTTQKNRMQAMEEREAQVKRECEEKVQRISKELASLNTDKEELARANESLQAEIGRLEAMMAEGPRGSPGPTPQTPRPFGGSMHRPSSPFATPGSMRKTISATQALDEYYKVKGQLNVEKQRSSNLAKDLEDVLEQLQAKAPELEELYAENERLQSEIKNMSHLSDESFRERDTAKKAARKAESAASQAQAEITILRNQLRDLSAQVQMLLFNMHCREKGLDELSIEETLHLQQLERGQIEGNADDISSVILQRLVAFKDIQELQEKNEKLLQVTHELGQRMESEEAIAAKDQAVEDHQERIRLQQELDVFRDTLRGFQIKTESITKERDMFRRIVESRVSGDELASALGRPSQDGVLASIEQNSTMNEESADYAALLEEIRREFDEYRKEQTTDRKTLKEQIEKLSAERNKLQTEVSRLSSQLSLASERYSMLKSNFAALESENHELQRRSQALSESAAKQDIRTQTVAEELVEAVAMVESMRNENANLRAEKKLWQDIQDRLSRDNENLVQEKSRLNGLLTTYQTLQNERELGDAEIKRRLQASVDSLEGELSITKRKLAEEVEDAKKAQLRKEFDAQQSQKRIDELTSNLSQIREESVAVKTSRDHLQSRVDELTIQLRSAEERTERLQPRPTPRPGSMVPALDEDPAQRDSDERIQELIHEATDLKRDLEMAKSQLENAQGQVERYRELSQASEEELERLNYAQEQYAQEMDNALSVKDTAIKELEQRVEDLSSELSRSNSELSNLRDSQAEVAHRFEEEKAILEDEMKRLKDEEEQYRSSSQFHQQDLRAQAEIAASAQQAYENEVMKHGETAKALSNVRNEHNELKTSVAKFKAEAESTKATLMQSESSWDERRHKFEQEISEIRNRWDDANAQNKILHQQLENVIAQISALQESRAAGNESLETISAHPSSSDADKYRELSNYLRREKEILEVQFELKEQDAKRLQQQLEYTQSQLDETRLKLDQERRSHGDDDRNTMAHKDLMSKLEELNLFRESSAALRAEARQAQAQLTERQARITELESRIQPLEAQIEDLQSQQSFKEAEMKQLQEDRDRWQKRTEDILSKHGRTDPAEVEELKQKVANLESERNTLQEAEAPLRETIQDLEKSIEAKEVEWGLTREKLVASAKERSRVLTTAKSQVIAEKEQLQKNFEQVTAELDSTREEMDLSKKAILELEAQVLEFKRQVTSLQANAAPAAPSESPDTQATLSELQNQLTTTRSELETISSQKASIEQELESTRDQLNSAIAEKEQAVAEARTQISNGDSAAEDRMDILQNGSGNAASQVLSHDERKALEDRITTSEARAAEWEAKAKEVEQNQDTIVKHRSDKMKETLNKRLTEFRESERAQSQREREKLEADFEVRLKEARKAWEAEHAGGQGETAVPNTPQQPKPQLPGATPSTPVPDLNSLGDQEVRELVSKNATVRSIVQNNIKSKLAAEAKKIKEEHEIAVKAEWEQKLTQAKDSATQLVTSKMNLKLNMTENRARMANAKIEVVETAAKETPQRPVGEVWEIAKVAKPLPVPKQSVPVAPTTLATPTGSTATTDKAAVTSQSTPAGMSPIPQEAKLTPSRSIPPKPVAPSHPQQVNNPFATALQNQLPQNPFTQMNQPAQPPFQQTIIPGIPEPAQLPASQIPKVSNLPVPGGARKPSGTHIPRGGGARGGGPQRPRGGGAHQGRASLNPSADNFQPGAKRPRGDSEGGNGPKRARGGSATGPQ